ncbi:MAG: nicotinate-nucleotide adenylyltransferase [Acidimicrobiia bacterium]|nr:nicotinate-nucleotide adenylyltransferase [Acidimicrobiia bacterium]MDH5616413.1 nicotinate-nucleotide adenylyltransferase [Acidimicrobiia bacterium]
MRRGILGGTFDPPHVAHLIAGEVAYRDLDLDVVTFLPAGAPWQKADRRVSDAEHRWQMICRAVENIPYFEADQREVRRDGWTFTADTLADFDPQDELILILGADAARGIQTWQRWEYVVSRAQLAVAPRPGVDRAEVDAVIPVPFTWLDMPLLLLSGTTIRRRAEAGKTIRFMVADSVWDYLEDHNVYG